MGLYVSIKPQPTNPWAHKIWLGAFFAVGALTAGASYNEMNNAEVQQTISSTTQKNTSTEIKDLISSIDKLSTGLAQISTSQDYQLLTNPQADALIQALRPFAGGTAKVRVSCVEADVRACVLANQWSNVLKIAGWDSDGIDSDFYTSPPLGVFITVSNVQTTGAGIIQHALLTTGLVAQGQVDPKTPPNEIDILFGGYQPTR
jgi:hypothetical protein